MVELPELDHALQKTEKSLTMYAVMMHSASRRIVPAVLIAVVLAVPAAAQEFAAGEPIGALNEAGSVATDVGQRHGLWQLSFF